MRSVLAALIALTFLTPLSVFADTESSQHYMIEQGTLSGGDNTDSSSGSYSSQSSLGEPTIGADSSGTGGTGGGTNNSGSGSGGSSGGGVVGCADPAASNYSPQALSGNDSSCVYASATLAQATSAPQSSNTAQAAAVAEAASSNSTPSGSVAPVSAPDQPTASLILNQINISPGSPVSAQVSFSNPLSDSAVITFLVVRPDGSVATTSTKSAQAGAMSISSLISSLQLPPGLYTLHVDIAYADGTNQDLNEPFTVAKPLAWYQSPEGEWALIFVVFALCLLFFYFRARKR